MPHLPRRSALLSFFWLLVILLGLYYLGSLVLGRTFFLRTGAGFGVDSGLPLYVHRDLLELLSLPLLLLISLLRYVGPFLLVLLIIALVFAPSNDQESNAQPSPMFRSILGQIFFLLLLIVGSMLIRKPFAGILSIGSSILSLTLTVSIIYGLVRTCGIVSVELDRFFERFPFPHVPTIVLKKPETINWRQVSLGILRFAGVVLVLSALFAIFFNISWSPGRKIIASIAGAGAFAACGILLRKRGHFAPASLSLLGSFALAQYTVSLFYFYLMFTVQAPLPTLLSNPHTWLFLKLLVAVAFLFPLTFAPSALTDSVFAIITFTAPFTFLYQQIPLTLQIGSLYLFCATAFFLVLGFFRHRPHIWTISTIAINAYLLNFATASLRPLPNMIDCFDCGFSSAGTGMSQQNIAFLALIMAAIFFLAHLITSVSEAHAADAPASGRVFHAVAFEVMALVALHGLQPHLPFLKTYIGVAWVIVAGLTFVGFTFLNGERHASAFRTSLLHLSMIFSAIGIFLQVAGPWSAVAFLAYALILLWYSFHSEHPTTRIYGFIVLSIALLKLYREFSDIFKSIPGTLVLLCLGLLFVVLSYRFDFLHLPVAESKGKRKRS